MLTAHEVAEAIGNFLRCSSGAWDWDDFTSSPISDPALDLIRRRALAINLPLDDRGFAELHALQREAEGLIGTP
ncbi:MAG: hypothetical protein EOP60_07155 [Sphingomonadales bacterium]|nr:MAG: hypothetical protein EOP60_07155 [Sphingomonadales bacterium]